jgi:predicted Zn-dependent peptidase
VAEKFYVKELPNGLTLLGQKMENVSSTALTMLLPAGVAHEQDEQAGAASIACEWMFRGAGAYDTRQLNDLLDSLGCQHNESVLSEHVSFSAAQLGNNLAKVLAIYRDVLLAPRLEDAAFETCRQLALQDLASLEDEPAQKCNLMLRESFYPQPLGRNVYGRTEALERMTAADVRRHVAHNLTPRGAIIGVAGDIDWDSFCDLVERHLGSWKATAPAPIVPRPAKGGVTHIEKPTAQAHIALAFAATPIADPRYYAARMAEMVLSGGMSSRLFTEVREKLGLVYHVSMRYHSLKGHAGMFVYAGTTPQKAQETLDVTVREIRKLHQGVTTEEMARARTQLKSSMVMQGESTSARSGAIASDWYHLRKLRSLAELSAAVDAVKADEVIAYCNQFPPDNLTVLYIGPDKLNVG